MASNAAPLRASPAIRRRYPMLLGILLACVALQWTVPLATLGHRFSWDYGEGWNAYWGARAMAGLPLYTGRLSPVTNNYPALSFYIMGLAGRAAGDQILGGRLVSLAALLACAGMVGALAARAGATRRWAAASALGFLGYVGCFAWRYIASDDPQWLAASFTLAALLLLVRPERGWPGAVRLVGAALLLVVGGLIKHNQLAAPVAITLWLLLGRKPGLLLAWVAAGGLLAGAALAGIHVLFGPIALDQILHHERVLKFRYLANALQTVSGLLPEMGLAWMLWRTRKAAAPDPAVRLLLLFGVVALGWGIFERFGTGVSVNAHFDTALAFFILGGVALGGGALTPTARWRMSVAALVPLVASVAIALPATLGRLAALDRNEAQWQAAIATIRAAPGPVACEMPALCYWAGRPFLVDFFNYGQKLRRQGDPAHLADAIRQRRFAAMVVVRDDRYRTGDGRLPPDLNRLVERVYHPLMTLPDHLLLLAPNLPDAGGAR